LTAIPKNPSEDSEDGAEKLAPRSPLELSSLEELGAYLLAERENQGVSRSDISSRTKISMDQLANIEAGTFTGLAHVYAKGFLRSYAVSLGLDPTDLIVAYKKLSGDSSSDPRKPLTSKYKEIELSSDDGISFTGAFLVILLIFAVLAILTIFNTRFHNLVAGILPFVDRIEAADAAPAPTPENATQELPLQANGPTAAAPMGQAAANPPNSIQEANTPGSPEPLSSTDTSPLPPNAPAPQDALLAAQVQDTRSTASPGGRLYLTATKPTWVQAVVDNGQIIHLYMKEGENHTFESTQSVNITTGDGSSLEASWNGEKLGPIGPARPTEAHFPPPRS
jgi:cytoskeleton protein RodZ